MVNMFLTGFDATTLNTLWVDKNLRYHGLLQAYSRTNRILNSVKTYGNIVCFRNLEDATNKCLALFGDPTAKGVSILRPFEDYFDGYDEVKEDENGEERQEHVKGYTEYLEELRELAQPGEMPLTDADKKLFIKLFGGILKIRNLLTSFDQFAGQDPLSERNLQDYTSIYLSLRDWAKENAESGDKTNINDDIEFEMELVKQVEVNIDYIL
ncbi:type I site-specific deoxyribonuclease, HsdR, partial [human gut metagenome]